MCDNMDNNVNGLMKISEMNLSNGDEGGKRKDYLGKFYK